MAVVGLVDWVELNKNAKTKKPKRMTLRAASAPADLTGHLVPNIQHLPSY